MFQHFEAIVQQQLCELAFSLQILPFPDPAHREGSLRVADPSGLFQWELVGFGVFGQKDQSAEEKDLHGKKVPPFFGRQQKFLFKGFDH